ncbi:MAG: hypothetical protein QXR97_06435, partial [Thermoproteota archaeon]
MRGKEIVNEEIYGFKAKDILESLLMPIKIKDPKNNTLIENVELSDEALALIWEFAKELSEKLSRKPSTLYRIMSKSPISYKIIPTTIRDKILNLKTQTTNLNYVSKLKLEEIRQKFLEAIGYNINTEEDRSICIITHDVDSEKGLERSLRLKEVEERCEVESTWFLLTEEYKLDKRIFKRLAENGEVALHGDKHQANFYNLEKGEMMKRLK